MHTIFENEIAKTDYDSDKKLVTVTWKESAKAITMEEYKQPFEEGLIYMESSNAEAKYFLSDIRNQRPVSPKYRKWFQSVAIQRASDAGIIRGAVVMENNVFKKYYINHIMKTLKKVNMEFKAHKSVEKAIEWLTR